jgi:dTDP-4-dehydrorhamnose 3,5-epimerase
MKVIQTAIEDVLIIEPQVFGDDRGFFLESYNEERWQEETGITKPFVQDNHSRSVKGVLRGIHYQIKQPQGKLVRVVSGEVFDVAVDLRRSSPTFGKCVSVLLTADNKKQLWIPEGFGHGFLVVSDTADFLYKTTDYYSPENERCIIWNDAELNIDWPKNITPQLSAKDEKGVRFAEADVFE